MEIVLVFDVNLKLQAEGLIKRLFELHSDVVINCIVDFDFKCNNVKIVRINKDKLDSYHIDENDHLSVLTYARLLMGSLVSSDFVLYLDIDILVQSELTELLIMRTSEAIAWCCHASSSHERRLSKYGYSGCYMQAGVFVANLNKWRALRIEESFLELSKSLGSEAIMWDQDILNIAFQHDSKVIGQRFNVFRRIHGDQFQSAVIIHYDGADKPWHWGSRRKVSRLWREANNSFESNYVSRGILQDVKNLLRSY